jgi:2-hydroxychromene-2-carboxylate isomerase
VTKYVKLYFDYKSPYSYLAKDLVYTLEEECDVEVEWLPYLLDIASKNKLLPAR